jgi:RNA polymerase sigma-70 factor (ECF subfamily)
MAEAKNPRFPTTSWTLVARLRSGDAEVVRRALEDLIGQYRYPLYAYIRRRGLAHHDAEDALQEYLAKLLRLRALEKAESEQGRLRSFLMTMLQRFLLNWRRDEALRGEFRELPDDDAAEDDRRYERERFTDRDTPEHVFERRWGHALLARVLDRLRAQCEERGKGALFAALRPVLLAGGSLRGQNPAAIATDLGMSEGALRVALARHLREYRQILEEEVRQTVERDDDVADEIAHLMSLFNPGHGNSGALRRPPPRDMGDKDAGIP